MFTEKEFSDNPFENKECGSERERTTKVTATLLPAPKEMVDRKVAKLENQLAKLARLLQQHIQETKARKPTKNKEGVVLGTVLQGESRGQKYTLEVVEDGYLCSDGNIYQSLSGAALGVSGNRRSGWRFWRDVEGRSIGEIAGRFEGNAEFRPYRA